MKRMIKGGRVVSSHEIREADIRIEDGIITVSYTHLTLPTKA